jgi:uncharacterized protein with beta-barrel porin domain
MRQVIAHDNLAEVITPIKPLASKLNLVVGSSKLFTVPSNEQWHILSLMALLTSSATVGNRQLAALIFDNTGNMVMKSSAGAVQAASLARRYNYLQCATREAAFVNVDELICSLPKDLYLGPGWLMYVQDVAAIAAGSDTLAVSMSVHIVNL